jgi:hypothetical protein
MSLEMQNHTHTQIIVIIDTSKQGYNIMRPYIHDDICKITHTQRSCLQVVDLAARGHQTSSISTDGLET